ncbi:MAG: DNA-binding protein [ANME-2 cluster archaeon]|jgi:programmed cell death protein 5|nr:MAG: DNA-binding protein [ANME-2 cluster archaeon]NOQ28592.1 DNA-binding protein [Methanosarcinales archaeon]
MSDELEEIKRRRLEQMQQQQAGAQYQAQQQQAQQQQVDEAKQTILRQILTPDARERLTSLKLARPQLAEQVEMQLISLAQSGRLQTMIDDAKLKVLLQQIQPKKREMTIKHI